MIRLRFCSFDPALELPGLPILKLPQIKVFFMTIKIIENGKKYPFANVKMLANIFP